MARIAQQIVIEFKGGLVTTDIALAFTAVGFFGAMLGLRLNYRERLRKFELMYVQRYWKIIDDLSLIVLKGSKFTAISERDEKIIRNYILLCEDELEVRANGYISDRTYVEWRNGILTQFDQIAFREVWQRVNLEASFPYEHLSRILEKRRVDGSEEYDPLRMGSTAKLIHGLIDIHDALRESWINVRSLILLDRERRRRTLPTPRLFKETPLP